MIKEAPRLVIVAKVTGETAVESAKSLSLADFIRTDQLKPGGESSGKKSI